MVSVFATALLAQVAPKVLGPFQSSTNVAFDLQGTWDSRPYTYGFTDFGKKTVQFNPPFGYRTRILEINGDLIANPETWAVTQDGKGYVPAPPENTGVLVLFSVENTNADEGSSRCSPCSDGSYLVLQNSWPASARIHYERDTHLFGLLPADNKLVLKTATFFNTTGLFIHIEPTLNFTYQFEKD